jgi:hypothetical protein
MCKNTLGGVHSQVETIFSRRSADAVRDRRQLAQLVKFTTLPTPVEPQKSRNFVEFSLMTGAAGTDGSLGQVGLPGGPAYPSASLREWASSLAALRPFIKLGQVQAAPLFLFHEP